MAPTLEASLNTCNQQNIKQLQKRQENTQNLTTNSIKSGHLSAAYHTTLADQNVGPFALMLNRIEAAFNRTDSSVDVDELWRVLEDYKSSPDEWAKFAFYDMTKYKRNLVAEYDKFNVMIICWGPGSRSSIHDHSGSHCFMKVLEGELVESRFAWPDESALKGVQSQEMCLISDTLMKHDQVHYINDKVGLHLVENPNPNKTAASLHVYIPPYRKCKAFDQRTGRARECKIQFYSKCGRVIKEDEEAVAPRPLN